MRGVSHTWHRIGSQDLRQHDLPTTVITKISVRFSPLFENTFSCRKFPKFKFSSSKLPRGRRTLTFNEEIDSREFEKPCYLERCTVEKISIVEGKEKTKKKKKLLSRGVARSVFTNNKSLRRSERSVQASLSHRWTDRLRRMQKGCLNRGFRAGKRVLTHPCFANEIKERNWISVVKGQILERRETR